MQSASDRKASDIVMLDVRSVVEFADYFVICTGTSDRQIRAITRDIIDHTVEAGVSPLHTEGSAEAGWVLLDYGDVIVHVFSLEQRDYYRLEKLWSNAHTVLVVQ